MQRLLLGRNLLRAVADLLLQVIYLGLQAMPLAELMQLLFVLLLLLQPGGNIAINVPVDGQ